MRSRMMLLTGMLLTGLSGCTSFNSTVLSRLEDNSFIGISNGTASCNQQARPFKGIPVTLKVPTHLDIYIEEVYYLKPGVNVENEAILEEVLDQENNSCRLLNVRTNVIKSDKVFVVDFKRPGSGILDLNLTFDEEEQYFSKIVSSLTDTTITDTANLISTTLQGIQKFLPTSGAPTETESKLIEANNLIRDTRVVAYKRFDINEPDFEFQVEAFVNQHLNDCNQCSTLPAYDSQNR